jgi:hypothetical protein
MLMETYLKKNFDAAFGSDWALNFSEHLGIGGCIHWHCLSFYFKFSLKTTKLRKI